MRHRLVITSGEPAGIGPDICLSLSSQAAAIAEDTELYVIADPDLLTARAEQLGMDVSFHLHHKLDELTTHYQQNRLNIIPLYLYSSCRAGELEVKNSRYVIEMLDLACKLCLEKSIDAIVTGPLQKSIINDAGLDFTGHTEYLADYFSDHTATGNRITPVMMLATDSLRVALATTHLPLKLVSQAITRESLKEVITILNNFLITHADINKPEILVCGLNPHAGEDGNLGDEEIKTITPVLEDLTQQGLHLKGPLPADTLFTDKYLKDADAVLAMYHDQGLPVLKFSGFGKAVNITLGLPVIRTSVDHGTALDLAGTGKASNSSLLEAIKMAVVYCKTQPTINN